MNGKITQVKNKRSTRQVEIHYQDEQGQETTIALTPERIVELYIGDEGMRAKWQQDLHYAWQNAKLLEELIDYLDIISTADFKKQFPDDPKEYKAHWAEWLYRYTQQRKARSHFYLRKGVQS